MRKRTRPCSSLRQRRAWRVALALIAALVLVSGAVVGHRAGRNVPSRQTLAAPARIAGPESGALRPGLG
ncbi:MAG TPA: hypothetical protein VFD32_10150 [Dehalococcoidia bacterium]|nr:hypothetical protein [Dehalococcoidia bacterium]